MNFLKKYSYSCILLIKGDNRINLFLWSFNMNVRSFQRVWFSLSIISAFVIIFTGCGDDKSPTGSSDTYLFTVSSDINSKTVDLADLEPLLIENQEAVSIADLVDTNTYSEPSNYAYRLVGSDGFYANVKGTPDNTYEHIQGGYIVLSTMSVTFAASLDIINRYNIKDVAELKILRKINFVTPADSLIQYVIADLEKVTFQDSLDAVPLTAFLPQDTLVTPSTFSYELATADDYSKTITYEELQQGYYVIDEDKVLYSNPDIEGSKTVKELNSITAVSQ